MAADFDATRAVIKESASLLPTPAARLLNRSAIAACDGLDGLTMVSSRIRAKHIDPAR